MLLVIVKNERGEVCAEVPYSGGALTIGRDKTRHIVLASKAVSRHHGSLLSSGGKVLYIDEGSSNGSRVDGQTVTSPVALSNRSMVQIGEYVMTLQLQKSAAPESVAEPAEALAESAEPTAAPTPVASTEDTLSIVPMLRAQPVRESVPVANALEGFRITLDDKPRAAPRPVAASAPTDKVAGLLDQQIQGIRSQRQDAQDVQRERRERFEQAWRDAILAAKQLKARIGNDPRVLFFVIARDEREVTVKLKENSSRGFCNFGVSLHHPIKETVAQGIAWFAETGSEPRAYNDPKEMMEDFVRAIASKLA